MSKTGQPNHGSSRRHEAEARRRRAMKDEISGVVSRLEPEEISEFRNAPLPSLQDDELRMTLLATASLSDEDVDRVWEILEPSDLALVQLEDHAEAVVSRTGFVSKGEVAHEEPQLRSKEADRLVDRSGSRFLRRKFTGSTVDDILDGEE